MTINKTTKYTTDPNTIPVTTETGEQELSDSIDDRVTKVGVGKYKNGPVNFTSWNPDAQPNIRTLIDYDNASASDIIANLWEPLRSDNTDWVSRRSLGLDASGEYTVWEYSFEPDNYDRTVVIGSLIHGGEIMSMLGTYAFFKAMADNPGDPHLAYSRMSTKWVVVPILNPWGVSQSPRTRYNSTGVDLNRNFDFFWDDYDEGGSSAFDPNYKGTSAFSEVETQYFRDIILNDYPDAVAVLDTHSFVSPGSDDKYIVYLPDYTGETNRSMFVDLVEELTRPGEENLRLISYTNFPSSQNYFAALGYTSANLEYAPQSATGSTEPADSEDMTQVLRWYGNAYIRVSTRESGAQKMSACPFVRHYTHSATPTIPSSATYQNVFPEDTFTVPTQGVLELSGHVTFRSNSTTASNFFIKHAFGQDAASREQFKSSNSTTVIESYTNADNTTDRFTIPFHACIPVGPERTIRFSPQMRGDNSEGTLLRYSATIKFTPTDSAVQYSWFESAGPSDPWADGILEA